LHRVPGNIHCRPSFAQLLACLGVPSYPGLLLAGTAAVPGALTVTTAGKSRDLSITVSLQ
jgi:hypothetical protein